MLDTLRRFKAGIFKALAHPTRVAIVEYLRYGEADEQRLREKIGVGSEELAQHITILCKKAIVQASTVRGRTHYSLRDQAFGRVLEAMREYYLGHLNEVIALLRDDREFEDA